MHDARLNTDMPRLWEEQLEVDSKRVTGDLLANYLSTHWHMHTYIDIVYLKLRNVL